MGTRKGRRIAIAWIVVVGVGIVVVSVGVACRRAIVEQWYISRLGSDDEATRLYAADRLDELRSVRAVPHLLELIKTDGRENVDVRLGFVFHSGPPGSEPAHLRESIAFTPLAYAIYEIGPSAAPLVREAWEEHRGRERLGLLFFLLGLASNDECLVKRMGYDGSDSPSVAPSSLRVK